MAWNTGLGVSFLPGQDGGPEQQRSLGGQGSGVPPIQQAIRFLSLRLPRFAGPNAIAPDALLNAPGGAGLSADLAAFLGRRAAGRVGSLPPAPRVGPGVTDPRGGPFGSIPPPRIGPGSEAPAPGPPSYLPGANQTSRGGAPFYRDPTAPVTGQAIPRTGGANSAIGQMSPDALMAAYDRVRRGGYNPGGGV